MKRIKSTDGIIIIHRDPQRLGSLAGGIGSDLAYTGAGKGVGGPLNKLEFASCAQNTR